MPLDTCITNVGEYYSSHYLDSTFSKDLTKWTRALEDPGLAGRAAPGSGPVHSLLPGKDAGADEETPIEGPGRVKTWPGGTLISCRPSDTPSCQPFDIPVDGGHAFVPALGRMNRYNRPWLVVCETVFCLPEGSLKEGMPSEDPLEMAPDGIEARRVHRTQALRRRLEPLSGAGIHRGGRPTLGAVSGRQPGVAAGPQHVTRRGDT